MSSPHWQPVSMLASTVMENLRALGPKISRNMGQVSKKLGSGTDEKMNSRGCKGEAFSHKIEIK